MYQLIVFVGSFLTACVVPNIPEQKGLLYSAIQTFLYTFFQLMHLENGFYYVNTLQLNVIFKKTLHYFYYEKNFFNSD